MKERWKNLFSVLLFFLVSTSLHAQNSAFKLLLELNYDSSFPLIYPYQEEDMRAAVLLDTREIKEYQVSHIPGAIWVGFSDFDIKRLAGISKDQVVVVYCSIGVRSETIGKKLKTLGFEKVFNLYGGIFHWVNEGNSVEANGRPTTKVHAYNRVWGVWLNQGEKIY